jgi:hypothetical protein
MPVPRKIHCQATWMLILLGKYTSPRAPKSPEEDLNPKYGTARRIGVARSAHRGAARSYDFYFSRDTSIFFKR